MTVRGREERFIVGTGCCGSALLSRMLGCNRHVLPIQGFWSILDRDAVFAEGSFSGDEAVALADRNNILNDLVVSRSGAMDGGKVAWPRMEPPNRAAMAGHGPALRIFLDPHHDDPDGLHADAVALLKAQPVQPLAAHWGALFGWLTKRARRRVWIERSSASIEHVGTLIDWYPNGRFVHIHRDGPRNALGLRSFPHFLLYASFFTDPPDEGEIARALSGPAGGADDPILRRLTRGKPSVAAFGHYWSWQVSRGAHDLMRLPAQQRLDVRYEDLVERPRTVLSAIAEFFSIPDDRGWMERAALEIDPEGIPDRVASLDPETRAALERACLPGQAVLGQVRRNIFEETMQRARRVATLIGA